MAFTGVVLTGGAGRRMPDSYPPKPLILLAGSPLVSYPLAALTAAGASEVLAVGGGDEAVQGLVALGLVPVAETEPGRGPLGGITRALDVSTHDLAVVLACDTPLIAASTVIRLLEAADGHDGATAAVGGRREPLIAAYRRSVRPTLEAALVADSAVHPALARLRLASVDIDPDEAWNVNTPADLEEAAVLLLRRRSTWPEGDGK